MSMKSVVPAGKRYIRKKESPSTRGALQTDSTSQPTSPEVLAAALCRAKLLIYGAASACTGEGSRASGDAGFHCPTAALPGHVTVAAQTGGDEQGFATNAIV